MGISPFVFVDRTNMLLLAFELEDPIVTPIIIVRFFVNRNTASLHSFEIITRYRRGDSSQEQWRPIASFISSN